MYIHVYTCLIVYIYIYAKQSCTSLPAYLPIYPATSYLSFFDLLICKSIHRIPSIHSLVYLLSRFLSGYLHGLFDNGPSRRFIIVPSKRESAFESTTGCLITISHKSVLQEIPFKNLGSLEGSIMLFIVRSFSTFVW